MRVAFTYGTFIEEKDIEVVPRPGEVVYISGLSDQQSVFRVDDVTYRVDHMDKHSSVVTTVPAITVLLR